MAKWLVGVVAMGVGLALPAGATAPAPGEHPAAAAHPAAHSAADGHKPKEGMGIGSSTSTSTSTSTAGSTAKPAPTAKPTPTPTPTPTVKPTLTPTAGTTVKPTLTPTAKPTPMPTPEPTATPTATVGSGARGGVAAPKAPLSPKKPAVEAAVPVEPAGRPAPPLDIASLRDEIERAGSIEDRASGKTDREKLEKLASEVTKAREVLRQDTARLEALLTSAVPKPAAAPPGPTEDEGNGEAAKKKPTSLDGLAKAMRGMKPVEAAPIISRIDRKTAADVLQRMPAIDAGKVLGQCKPDVAAEIATEIASRTPRSELKR